MENKLLLFCNDCLFVNFRTHHALRVCVRSLHREPTLQRWRPRGHFERLRLVRHEDQRAGVACLQDSRHVELPGGGRVSRYVRHVGAFGGSQYTRRVKHVAAGRARFAFHAEKVNEGRCCDG